MKTPKSLFAYCCVFVFLLLLGACEEEGAPDCETNNTATLQFQNTNVNGNLHVFIDTAPVSVNAIGDLSVAPGEEEEIEVPTGPRKIYARLVISSCTNNRCSTQIFGQADREAQVGACDIQTLVY